MRRGVALQHTGGGQSEDRNEVKMQNADCRMQNCRTRHAGDDDIYDGFEVPERIYVREQWYELT